MMRANAATIRLVRDLLARHLPGPPATDRQRFAAAVQVKCSQWSRWLSRNWIGGCPTGSGWPKSRRTARACG